ncbi:MAG: DUF3883 domain-containing protein [bacterium]|nr:DUF3883 domain-containing protein [bacterium]
MELIRQGVEDRDALVEALRVAAAAATNRAHNTLETLREIGAIAISDEGWCTSLIGPAPSDGAIRARLLKHYLDLLDRSAATSLFQLGHDGRSLRVSAAQLPGRAECYPYALLEFDIFRREDIEEPFWTVADDVVDRFTTWLKQRNLAAASRMFSLADLKAAQNAREMAGRVAEEWALRWERARLAGHLFVDSVRSISEENAGAGFDIVSFDGLRALSHDRFIEVKGYTDEFSFFWSHEEMEAARRLRMRYWLYLVDRRLISSPAYHPETIQDPVGYFLDRDPIGWSVSAQGHKFTRLTA